ncbi:FecCD family ABC transporter permease [Gordonia hydrophobica]|uniref:Iron chelate uptake ABC transporter family permease subunit n=1 Tax=Gordonia hydrophobica TaxID=40516 RepID=A0ABZ2U0Q8_9ACTN|nr:iron chelate uptake ABC transporter family permease subunit [Gordonia hydrophobica]MBM7367708.1 iron complex transport system permease protein [Gordonia hydrophobica]
MTTLKPRPVDVGYHRTVLSAGGYSVALRRRSVVVAVALMAVILVCGVAALAFGSYHVSPTTIVQVLLGGGERVDRTVVLAWRVPRALAAVLLGGFLAVAGAVFQTVTRNPLASPDILGLANGAFTGMLLTVVVFSAGWSVVTLGAVLGGLATAVVIWALARHDGFQGFRLIVIGIGVSAMLASLNTWMLLETELETAMFASAWGAGTLNGVTAQPVVIAAICGVPLLAALALLTPRLRQLDLGDDVALATGVRPARDRTIALGCAVGLVSIATAVVGPVAFVALAAPQIARRLARTPYLPLTVSALTGGLLLLVADLIAQHVLPVTLPAGVVTVSVGGIYLVVMLIQEVRRRA